MQMQRVKKEALEALFEVAGEDKRIGNNLNVSLPEKLNSKDKPQTQQR